MGHLRLLLLLEDLGRSCLGNMWQVSSWTKFPPELKWNTVSHFGAQLRGRTGVKYLIQMLDLNEVFDDDEFAKENRLCWYGHGTWTWGRIVVS